MLHSCAEYLTHTLYRHYPLSEEKRPVFVYGFELSLSTLSSILSIILLSIIFKNVYSSLLFLYIFFFLRLFSGGYHAPTYSRCFILTNAIFAFVYLLSEVIQWYKPLLIPFAILSCISIFLLSPIRSTKHPLSERLYAQNKKAARISHGLIRQYLRNYGVIPIKGVTPFFYYLSGFLRFFLFYSFHCINKLLLCRNVK